MAWVPLQEWQPGFEPNLNTISAGSADFVDSTIVFTGVTNKSSGAFAYAFWYAYNIGGFIAGETVRIRVECTRAEWGTYTAPSPPNVRLVGSSSADLQTVWAGGVPATFDIELVNTADSQGQVDLWMQWGSGSGGTLFTGGNFEFRISVWVDDPPGGTRWVPLAESGIDHALSVEPPFESSITLDGSTIVADNATSVPNFGIGWNLEVSVADVPEYFTGRVRVTTQIDYVDAPEAGPLVFYYSAEGGAGPSIINEHEDSTTFVPNPVVLGPLAPWSGPGSDGLVQFTAWGIDVLSATFYIEAEVRDDGPPSGGCFWTDLLNVTEYCGASPGPELDTVDAYYIGSIWGFIAVDDLTWNGPVLYTPPAGDVEYPAHTEVSAVTETDEIRAITGNTSVYPPGSVHIDGGRLKTDGVIEVQPWVFSPNTGDLRVEFVDDAWSVLYDGLPSEYKYAAFDPPLAVYPPRVGNLGVFVDDGDVQAYTAIAALTITAHNSYWDPPLYSGAPTSALITGASGTPQFTTGATVVPFGDYEYGGNSRGLFGITASSGGGWADGVINMQFDLHYKTLVAPPQHVAAVLKDCELFSFEQLAEAGADGVTTVPKAGTGLSIPFSFTVSHVASRGNTVEGGTIEDGVYSFILNDNGYDGAVISKTFTDYLLTEHGQYWFPYDMVLVGRLYAIDDLNTPIARIAFMTTSGGGGG